MFRTARSVLGRDRLEQLGRRMQSLNGSGRKPSRCIPGHPVGDDMFVVHASAAYILRNHRSSWSDEIADQTHRVTHAHRPREPSAARDNGMSLAFTVHRMFVAFCTTTCDRNARTRARLRDFIQ